MNSSDKRLAEVLGSLYAAFSGEQKPETQSPHWYRGYLTAINDVSKILLNTDLDPRIEMTPIVNGPWSTEMDPFEIGHGG